MTPAHDDRLIDLTVSDLRAVVLGVMREVFRESPAAMPDELLTTDEIARRMRVSPDTVRDWRHRGCPCFPVSERKLRWSLPDVLKWREEKRND